MQLESRACPAPILNSIILQQACLVAADATNIWKYVKPISGNLYQSQVSNIHSQIHDFEVEHVVRPVCVLSVSLQSTYKPFTSIGTFELHRNSDPLGTLWELQSTHSDMWWASTRILPHHQLKSYGHMLGASHVVNLAVYNRSFL